MKIINYSTEVRVYKGFSELSHDVVSLLKAARVGAQNAYAPYSHFKVGAAILLNNGEIIIGNNQENAAYPSGLCAERVAAFYAVSQYPEVPFNKLAIVSIHPNTPSSQPTAPCGGCRQVLLEYEEKFGQEIEIILASETEDIYIFKNAKDLLPFSFNSGYIL